MAQADPAANTNKRPDPSKADEPAKGGLKPADPKVHPSGDSPKAQGDKLEHAVDEATLGTKKKH
jgi:hypothetical protein